MQNKQIKKLAIVVAIPLIGFWTDAKADVISSYSLASGTATFTGTINGGVVENGAIGGPMTLLLNALTPAVFKLNDGDMITVTPQATSTPGSGVAAIFLLTSATPEPSSWSLLMVAGGLAVLYRLVRRRAMR